MLMFDLQRFGVSISIEDRAVPSNISLSSGMITDTIFNIKIPVINEEDSNMIQGNESDDGGNEKE